MLQSIVSNNLEKYRKRENMSQARLYGKTGVTQKTICLIENCTRDCKLETVESLCKGLNIQAFELFLSDEVFNVKHLFQNATLEKGLMEVLKRFYLIVSDVKNKEISDNFYRTYGIAVEDQVVPCFEDVSTDPNFVSSLVALFNELELDPDHLEDVLQDQL